MILTPEEEIVAFEKEADTYGYIDLYRRMDGSGYDNERTKLLFAFWKARGELPLKEEEEVMEMALCEIHNVVLQIGRAYRFVPIEGCKDCARMKAEHDKAYGIDEE